MEVCSSVQAIKYIHKYLYKGSHCATVVLDISQDEVVQYLQGQYIGPTEAVWHLFEFSTHKEFPPIEQLAVYLPGEQPVYFQESADDQELQERLDGARSTLTAFFEYNSAHEDGRGFLYQEFPEHYIYLQKEK